MGMTYKEGKTQDSRKGSVAKNFKKSENMNNPSGEGGSFEHLNICELIFECSP